MGDSYNISVGPTEPTIYRKLLPIATNKPLAQAKAMARSGDTIVVPAGSYAENDLLKDGVNWHFMPGAVITYTEADSGVSGAYGIFDDRSTGPCTCRITGALKIVHTMSTVNNQGFGTFVLTNAASDVYFQFDTLSIQNGFLSSAQVAGLSIRACARCSVDFNEILDPTYGAVTSGCCAIYWGKGDTFIKGKQIKVEQYSIWCDEPTGTPNTSLFAFVEQCDSNNGTCLYFTGLSANYRGWVICHEAKSNLLSAVLTFAAGGKFYVTAQKLSNANNAGTVQAAGGGSLWVTAQKITGSTGSWVLAASNFTGKLHVNCMEYEDIGTINPGFDLVAGGEVTLHGGAAKVLNGRGLRYAAGTLCRVKNLSLDTSNTDNAANQPVYITGGTGLVLHNCSLISGASAKGIQGSAAGKVVKNYGSVSRQAVDDPATVTVQVGAVTVSSNVT